MLVLKNRMKGADLLCKYVYVVFMIRLDSFWESSN